MKLSRRTVISAVAAAVLLCGLAAIWVSRSSRAIANRDPTGEVFPRVVGQSLDGRQTELPRDFTGESVVILVGYEQRAQFDIDRWFLGLLQAETTARIVEVPTIPGIVATLASGWIDDGMRSGIPSEDWGSVVTLYGGAARPVAALTGTENGQLARVLVIDDEGRIVWFDDTGYSGRKALAIAQLVESLGETSPQETTPGP